MTGTLSFAAASGWGAAFSGALLGISLAAPPGPIMAVMANAAMHGRKRESLITACGAMTADATWLLLASLGAATLLRAHPQVLGVLGLIGAILLVWMAVTTARMGRMDIEHAAPGGYRLGYVMVLTSPFSLAWWLANGAILFSTWGWPGIAGMFVALFVYSVFITWVFHWIGQRARRGVRAVAWVSVVALIGFAGYFAWRSLGLLGVI